jgi:hypothetical protein
LQAKHVFALIVFSSLTIWAADSIARLNIKEGLWEVTSTHSMTGMSIPPENLAKMPPEERARVEAMMKQNGFGAPLTEVKKECITREKLDKQVAFTANTSKCTRTIVSSTGSKLEMKLRCEREGKENEGDGTFLLEVVSPDMIKGTAKFASISRGRGMNMDFTFDGRYLGSACGDVK